MRFFEHFVVVNGNRSFSMMKYPTIIQQYLHFRREKKRNTWKGQILLFWSWYFPCTHCFFFTCFEYSQNAKTQRRKEENLCNDLKTLNKLGFIYKTTTYPQRSEVLKLECVSTCEMVHAQCSMFNCSVVQMDWRLKYIIQIGTKRKKKEEKIKKRAQRTKINKSQLKEVVNPLNRLKMALPFALLFHSEQSTEHWTHWEFEKWFEYIVLMCDLISIYISTKYIYFTFAIRCIPNNIPKWNALFLSNLFKHSIRHSQFFFFANLSIFNLKRFSWRSRKHFRKMVALLLHMRMRIFCDVQVQ